MSLLTSHREGAFWPGLWPRALARARQNRNPKRSQHTSLSQSHSCHVWAVCGQHRCNLRPLPWAGIPMDREDQGSSFQNTGSVDQPMAWRLRQLDPLWPTWQGPRAGRLQNTLSTYECMPKIPKEGKGGGKGIVVQPFPMVGGVLLLSLLPYRPSGKNKTNKKPHRILVSQLPLPPSHTGQKQKPLHLQVPARPLSVCDVCMYVHKTHTPVSTIVRVCEVCTHRCLG